MTSTSIEGFEIPLHRALAEPILLRRPACGGDRQRHGRRPLGIGLQLWIAGIALWAVGHAIAVFAAKRDPHFATVLARHLKQKEWLTC